MKRTINLKRSGFVVALAIVFFTKSINAQIVAVDDGKGINRISTSEYRNICINGVTRTAIEATEGNVNQMTALFNANFNVTTESEPDNAINFKDSVKGLFFSFVDHSDVGHTNELIYFEIFNNQSSFTVQGKTVKVGDNISLLGDVRVNTNKGTISFNCSVESSSIEVKFSKLTNTIISITYEVFT